MGTTGRVVPALRFARVFPAGFVFASGTLGQRYSGRSSGDRLKPKIGAGLRENFFRNLKCMIGGGNAAIDRSLQQHFLKFFPGYACVDGGAEMEPQFIRAIQRHYHGDRDQAACFSWQAGTRPDFSPGIAGNQVLERRIEFVLSGLCALHVGLAQHLFTYLHSFFVPLAIVHPCAPLSFRMAYTSRLYSSRASMLEHCAADSSVTFAP